MKKPWDEFLDIYRENREAASHEEAVVDALVGLMIWLDENGWSDYGERSLGLKEAADEWNAEDGTDWDALRDRLEDRWSQAAE